MCCEETTRQALRGVGLKATPQRLMILSALRHVGGHRTASQVFDALGKGIVPNPSTVYRTLRAANEAGIVLDFLRLGDEAEFEWNEAPHHHLVCQRCGALTMLAADTFSPLAATLRQETGFEVGVRHLAVRGTCRTCAGRSTTMSETR
jgi:Fe2+ or Zn2+ uptake regulation protein